MLQLPEISTENRIKVPVMELNCSYKNNMGSHQVWLSS